MSSLVLWLLLVARATPASAHSHNVTVPGLGTLYGRESGLWASVSVFHGVPYAKAPIGDLRWRSPEPHGSWLSPRDASRPRSACIGAYGKDEALFNATSEDCLFLSVASPAEVLGGDARLPVMVWIHGGSFDVGASTLPIYNLDAFAARSRSPVVAVALNYRLNAFGFLGSEALRSRSSSGSVGNYGIEDQRLALAWVRSHIGAFGGNGEDVTIFGQSSGGVSVLNHLTQPLSYRLYAKAVIESGTFASSSSMAGAEANFKILAGGLGCQAVSCLLNSSAQDIYRALTSSATSAPVWGPVIDGVSLADAPEILIARGDFNKVPVLLGSTRDEDAYAMVHSFTDLTEAQFDSMFKARFPTLQVLLPELKRIYAPGAYPYPADLGNYSQWWWTWMRIRTDVYEGVGPCSVRRIARALVRLGAPSVFVYHFAHPPQRNLTFRPGDDMPGTGKGNVLVPHSSEIPFVMFALEMLSVEDGETPLALAMNGFWAQFAAKGDPNMPNSEQPHWPRYTEEEDAILRFEASPTGIQEQRGLRKHACNFWDFPMAVVVGV